MFLHVFNSSGGGMWCCRQDRKVSSEIQADEELAILWTAGGSTVVTASHNTGCRQLPGNARVKLLLPSFLYLHSLSSFFFVSLTINILILHLAMSCHFRDLHNRHFSDKFWTKSLVPKAPPCSWVFQRTSSHTWGSIWENLSKHIHSALKVSLKN